MMVSTLVFISDYVSLGRIDDIKMAPMIASLALLIPLTWWVRQTRTPATTAGKEVERRSVWSEVLLLFSLAMVVRIPFVLSLGMSFEKTPIIYLLVLVIVLIKKSNLRSFGFRTENFGFSLLIGFIYYLAYGFFMFSSLLIFGYLVTGHLVIVGYDLISPLLVLPFMTFCVGVSEEALFRGFMQTRLAEIYSGKQALFVQAFLFGIWHFVWHIMPFDPIGMTIHISSTFALGLVFGYFFELSGNLIPLILAHGLVDTVGYGALIDPSLVFSLEAYLLSQVISFALGVASLAFITKWLGIRARVDE
jgi:membrane protease YdiL (CAAX protease family)